MSLSHGGFHTQPRTSAPTNQCHCYTETAAGFHIHETHCDCYTAAGWITGLSLPVKATSRLLSEASDGAARQATWMRLKAPLKRYLIGLGDLSPISNSGLHSIARLSYILFKNFKGWSFCNPITGPSHTPSTSSSLSSSRTLRSASSLLSTISNAAPAIHSTSVTSDRTVSTASTTSSHASAIPSTRPSTPPRDVDTTEAALRACYTIAVPSPLRGTASRQALKGENDELRRILKAAGVELEKNHAQMILMNNENGRLRQQLHAKKKKPKRSYTTGEARLMTSDEMMEALLRDEQKKEMKELLNDLRRTKFPGLRLKIRAQEKAQEKQIKDAEKAAKAANREVQRAAKAAEKEAQKAAKAVEREQKAAARTARGHGRGRARSRGASGRSRARGGGGGRGRGSRNTSEPSDSGGENESIQSDEDDCISAMSSNESPQRSPSIGPSPSPCPCPSHSGSSEAIHSAMGEECDSDDSDDGEETRVLSFNGHRWVARRNLELQVMWSDGDVTWEPLSNVDDCAAMDEYLAHCDVEDPIRLSRRKFLIDSAVEATNE
ncbi:hypothetical protein GGX14DRAFT_407231 [Mycena pura]|uniref:Chromo domain-containing protein n=1 Tax=Mycena pura TaxID=153505 RepID=A0AAD6UQD1_9AGAR|nr:hypothetical protein GGX14DRAFT_407231 [Mycena pura]